MKVFIYGKEECSYCDKAEFLCMMKQLKYEAMFLGVDFEKEDLPNQNFNTFPQIYIQHTSDVLEYIGGYDELRKYLRGK